MAERLAGRRAARRARRQGIVTDRRDEARLARTAAKATLASNGPTMWGLRLLTWMMRLDLLLFGGIRSGPYFVVLERR
jgi:hypothetical protein